MSEHQNDRLSEFVAEVPVQYRRVIARWLLERGRQYQPSFVLTSGTAMALQDAFAGAAVDLMTPLDEDTTAAHAAAIIREL